MKDYAPFYSIIEPTPCSRSKQLTFLYIPIYFMQIQVYTHIYVCVCIFTFYFD